MTSIPIPPATPDVGPLVKQEILSKSLDALLEHYLYLLDSYQNCRLKLTEELSSGYFSLAQANFKSPNRVRYGQDLYDQRMQALTKIGIEKTQTATTFRVFLVTPSASVATKPPAPRLLLRPSCAAVEKGKEPWIQAKLVEKLPQEPLNWFGILVPQALRTAQASFRSSLSEAVPNIINISMEMQDIEAEVEGLRRRMKEMK